MSATEEKFTAELQASDFKTNISSLEEENKALNGNIDELRNQMDDLQWQYQNSLSVPASGRPSFAPSIKSFHATDMTDVSIDADASTNIGMNLTDMSENLGDVVGRQLQEKVERIEELERDKDRLEDELVETRAAKDGVEKELDTKKELINDMRSYLKTLEGDNKRALEELNRERVERGIEVSEMKANIDNLSETLAIFLEKEKEPEWGEAAWGESVWQGVESLESVQDRRRKKPGKSRARGEAGGAPSWRRLPRWYGEQRRQDQESD